MAAVSLAFPVTQAIELLKLATNFIIGESFPVQNMVGMATSF
jgi:hypothetical protein